MFYENQQIGLYKLLKRIGRGGFGEVWLAERRTAILTTKVAVKLPLNEQIDLETVRREAVIWEKANGHPNVLPIIEANIYDNQIVIVSEYAPDGSLEDVLKHRGKLTMDKTVEMTLGILAGLEFLHLRRIIHRDLKPANILLQGEMPRIADFGISRALLTAQTSQSISIAGTPHYMAPEAYKGKRNEQTDIWSVGIILYLLLTGDLPFPQADIPSLYDAIQTRDPDPLPGFIPRSLKNIVSRSLAKNPEQRYKTTIEMREDLRTLASTKGPRTKAGSTVISGFRSTRIRQIAAGFVVFILVGFIIVVIANYNSSTPLDSSSNKNLTVVSPPSQLNSGESSRSFSRMSRTNDQKYHKPEDFTGTITFKDSTTFDYIWIGTAGSMGSWDDDINYSRNIENKTFNNVLRFGNLSRVDFIDMPESERERYPKENWPQACIKARVTFVDGTIWDSVYLHSVIWKYEGKNAEGFIVTRGGDEYLGIESISFNLK